MSYESKRSLEIELEEASRQVNVAFDRWNANRTVENEVALNDAKEYCHQVAYELQKWKMHDKLVENGYEFDENDEEIVIYPACVLTGGNYTKDVEEKIHE